MIGSFIKKAWAAVSSFRDQTAPVDRADILPLLGGLALMKPIVFEKYGNSEEMRRMGLTLHNMAHSIEEDARAAKINIVIFSQPLKAIAASIIEHSATTFVDDALIPIPTRALKDTIDNLDAAQSLKIWLDAESEQNWLFGMPAHTISNLIAGLQKLSEKYGLEAVPHDFTKAAQMPAIPVHMQKNLG